MHSDPEFQRLDESFASAAEIRCPVEYTGFVVRRPEHREPDGGSHSGQARIVASIGGGRVGSELLEAVIAASAQLQPTLPHEAGDLHGPVPARGAIRAAQ